MLLLSILGQISGQFITSWKYLKVNLFSVFFKHSQKYNKHFYCTHCKIF